MTDHAEGVMGKRVISVASSDGSTIGSMFLWLCDRCADPLEVDFWVNVYLGMRRLEGTWPR